MEKGAVSSLPDTTENDYKMLLNFVPLSSSVSDIPESEDLSSLKRGFQIVTSRHTCFANNRKLSIRLNDEKINIHHTRTIKEKTQNSKDKTGAELAQNMLSVHAVSLVHHSFPFARNPLLY